MSTEKYFLRLKKARVEDEDHPEPQASTSAGQAERQGQGEKEIDLLGIEERVGEEDSIQHAAVREPAEATGYTIMGKTADLTVSKRRPLTPCTRRARHKRSLQKRLAVHRALCPSTLIERRREGKDVVEKNVQAIGIIAPWRELKQNPFKNVGEIHKEWTAAGVSASRTTTHRRLQDMGFSCHIPCVKPLLNNRQRQKRLAWAKDKKDWTAAEWSKVMFSDESKFCISFGNQGPRVWRKRGEAQNPRCLRSSVKFPQSVMVWGAMSSAGVGPLCFLRSKVNAAVYQDVFEHFMLPAADQHYGDADFIFQQDLAPAHSAKATSTWFKDHEELKATIRATWALITPEQCHRLIDSMPRRIAAGPSTEGAVAPIVSVGVIILPLPPQVYGSP
ncbi:Transposable element Tc1 transposase [Labeo rohita]|uniref:Transposable element Tc1 transposase n=1 Tax=Labeo rohita TaxID=84645 RepID=A0ABQ8L594_LABRO|nr:Transposable element Tc1 transposase [Labeo rohita]